MDSPGFKKKKSWSARNVAPDEQLRLWVEEMWERGIFVTDYVIQEKVRSLNISMNSTAPPHEQTPIQFSDGWLYSSRVRHGFKYFKSHGEEGRDIASAALPLLLQIAAQYHFNDMFNGDEFSLAYSASLTSTISPALLFGRKKSKNRLTFFYLY